MQGKYSNSKSILKEFDSNSNVIFILSHVPRACYNDNNPPEAVENLEKYIIDQAREKYGLYLKDVGSLVNVGITKNENYYVLHWNNFSTL